MGIMGKFNDYNNNLFENDGKYRVMSNEIKDIDYTLLLNLKVLVVARIVCNLVFEKIN